MSFDLKAATTYPPGWLDQVLWAVRNAFCGQSSELSARFELSGAGYPPAERDRGGVSPCAAETRERSTLTPFHKQKTLRRAFLI